MPVQILLSGLKFAKTNLLSPNFGRVFAQSRKGWFVSCHGLFMKYSFLPKLAKAFLFNKNYPFSVSFVITHKCNFRCGYCNSFNQKEEEMSIGEIKQMLDELKQAGLMRLGITGGEPLLRKDLGEILEYAKQLGIQITLVTNGSLVKKNLEALKNLNLLIVSLEGPRKVHDKIRGKGTFEKAMGAIETAKKNKIRVWIEAVLTRDDDKGLDFLVNLSNELGCKILFQPIFTYPLSADKRVIEKLSPNKEVYSKLIEKIINFKKHGKGIVGSYSYFNWIKSNWPNRIYRKCMAGKLFCCISPGGKVAPCHFLLNARDWPDGKNAGFIKAFEQLRNNSCNGCFCNSYIETNLLFSKKTIEPKINFIKEFLGFLKD